MNSKGYKPFHYQEQAWQLICEHKSGLVNAPTGTGKTFSVFLGAVINYINQHPENFKKKKNGLQLIWVTPLRALAKDIGRAMEEVLAEFKYAWSLGYVMEIHLYRKDKSKREIYLRVLIITPESIHLLLAQKEYPSVFKTLQIIAVDEWHELLASKRGVQVELALSRIIGLRQLNPEVPLSVWGISATIGNLQEAMNVLLAPLSLLNFSPDEGQIVSANLNKKIEIQSIIPDEIEKYPLGRAFRNQACRKSNSHYRIQQNYIDLYQYKGHERDVVSEITFDST